MNNINSWIQAFRLRTLTLALASILMAAFLAAYKNAFRWDILILSLLTTLFLQILSNLANDYGDSQNDLDNEDREGPARTVQQGLISSKAMRTAIGLFIGLSAGTGIALLLVSLGYNERLFYPFLGLGFLAIIASISYTVGKKPYGYIGLGDLSVFVFFGLVGVIGSVYLYTSHFSWMDIFPAASCGLFSTAVLNINNIRDINSDRKAGKKSLAVRLGRNGAVIYHWLLILGGMICAIIYAVQNNFSLFQWAFLLVTPWLIKNALAVKNNTSSATLDPFLKQMAITTLIFVLLFGLPLIWL